MPLNTIVFLIILIIAVVVVYKAKKLTVNGALAGGLTAILIYIGAGMAGITELAAFFILATLATAHKKQLKSNLPNEHHQQKRNLWQVVANGGIAAVCGVFAFLFPSNAKVFQMMMAGSLASATADTLSSELGSVYGKRFYNILTSKPDERGKDGVISLEGTLIGVIGSAIIALMYVAYFGFSNAFYLIIAAGVSGNFIDSILGATLERRGSIGNNTVNAINTFAAAIIVWLLYQL
ncbi:DUF92 domain-containing protein [Mucilaginibacter achroorhodeus]|uniref:DUF92 domain-containing protein n=1 Tax=Mucilaginibacter achroorhodeus TaxID=2599294 RepID=A0A563U464_9SPHI|nr:DUF92 domain-containing protein [Mucilaginibacter achroorhodeus]TWR26131.1 DUF92 domain-containing protein [Mucilaginibacter achroorhodeus]